jgi:hypothetical protein
MKIAVSLPNPIFEAAEQAARRLGWSRSELYAKAVADWLEAHRSEGVTEALNRIYAEEESALDEGLIRMQAWPRDDEW